MSKTAAKQRVSAKRVLRMGAVTCLVCEAATHGTCGFVNGCPVNSDETTAAKQRVSAKCVLRMGAVTCLALSPKGFYNSDYCSLYIHLYLC